jgi:hypothetical protein
MWNQQYYQQPVYAPPPPPATFQRLPGVSYNGTVTQAPKLSFMSPQKIVAYTQQFNAQRPELQGWLPCK